MKRYALFTHYEYESQGGWADLSGLFDTVEEAETAPHLPSDPDVVRDYAHIVDLEAGEIVFVWNATSREWKPL